MTKIKQIFIFAAGEGRRMRPLTERLPKPLVRVKNKAIIDYIIEKLPQNVKIMVNCHYLAQEMAAHFEGKGVELCFENEKLETGGGLALALEMGKIDENEAILLLNGDIMWQEEEGFSEIADFSRFFSEDKCDILLGLKKSDEVLGYDAGGDFNLCENGDLRYGEGQKSHVFVGFAIVNPKILSMAPERCFSMGYFYKNARGLGLRIKGVELKSRFFHIGDPETLKRVEEEL